MNTVNTDTAQKLRIRTEDVRNLVAHPDREVRTVLAQKICRQIRTLTLSKKEQAVIREILWFIARDSAAMVRRALAVTLRQSPNLPHDVAQALIRDVDSIAVPVLEYSPVLTDEDLLEVLRSKAAGKMLAISHRKRITGELVKAILRYGDSRTIASLAANDGAEIGARLGAEMLEIYKDDDLIKESFIARKDLPPLVVEKLLTMISGEAARKLVETHEIPIETAIKLAGDTRERAGVDFIAQSWVHRDLALLVERLEQEDRLTNSMIIRAVSCGQIRFVEQALAVKAGVRVQKAALMLHDSGPFALKALCTQAGLGALQMALIRAGIVIYRDLETSGNISDKREFQRMMLERILSLPLDMSDAQSDWMYGMLDRCSGRRVDYKQFG